MGHTGDAVNLNSSFGFYQCPVKNSAIGKSRRVGCSKTIMILNTLPERAKVLSIIQVSDLAFSSAPFGDAFFKHNFQIRNLSCLCPITRDYFLASARL